VRRDLKDEEFKGWKFLQGIFKNSKTKDERFGYEMLTTYRVKLLKKYITEESYNKILLDREAKKYNL
jgi:hypothetical protein